MNVLELRDMRGVAARYPMATALAISLLIHVCVYQFWRVGKQLGWWRYQATWLLQLHPLKSRPREVRLTEQQQAALLQALAKRREIPLTFVEVDPRSATAEPPPEAKFYGLANTKAANPDPTRETDKPKIDGQQDKVVRLEDVPKPKPFPLQPAVPQEKPATADAESRPKPAEDAGNLARNLLDSLKHSDASISDPGTGQADKRERYSSLIEARIQKGLAGQKMRQAGGVANHGRFALDVKMTPFSAYDAAFIAAVQQRWYDLLDNTPFSQRSGKVVLEFLLTEDGLITEMKVIENQVGELLGSFCQRAIQDPAPYPKWPSDMRRMIASKFREVTFTFYYY
jgi:hypothetical protein